LHLTSLSSISTAGHLYIGDLASDPVFSTCPSIFGCTYDCAALHINGISVAAGLSKIFLAAQKTEIGNINFTGDASFQSKLYVQAAQDISIVTSVVTTTQHGTVLATQIKNVFTS
jgi:hypothetical protein